MGRAGPVSEDLALVMPVAVDPAATLARLAQAHMTCLHDCCANLVPLLLLLHEHDGVWETLPG